MRERGKGVITIFSSQINLDVHVSMKIIKFMIYKGVSGLSPLKLTYLILV